MPRLVPNANEATLGHIRMSQGVVMCVCAAGHFKCASCPRHAVAAFEYFLVLAATIRINAFLIWRFLDDTPPTAQAEGSDYVEV